MGFLQTFIWKMFFHCHCMHMAVTNMISVFNLIWRTRYSVHHPETDELGERGWGEKRCSGTDCCPNWYSNPQLLNPKSNALQFSHVTTLQLTVAQGQWCNAEIYWAVECISDTLKKKWTAPTTSNSNWCMSNSFRLLPLEVATIILIFCY